MTKIIKVLDLFCGVGGASVGYQRAGCEVVGVDINPQPNYPFTFVQADAIDILNMPEFLARFDFIHASPPCQCYCKISKMHKQNGKVYPDLLPSVRELLIESGKPYVIENVPEAPIRHDLKIDGRTFIELRVIRLRSFEFADILLPMFPIRRKIKGKGTCKNGDMMTVAGKGLNRGQLPYKHHTGTYTEQRKHAMAIDWAKKLKEVNEAIPPQYTTFIMEHIAAQIPIKRPLYA